MGIDLMNIDQLLKELTLEEKASLLSGQDFWHTRAIPRLGIPAIMMTDGPHGLRKEAGSSGAGLSNNIPATCFPTAACLASSWDRSLLAEVGSAIAEEALEEKVSVVLGPGANIKRSPLCGRNFEYLSEDPYLAGEAAAAYTNPRHRFLDHIAHAVRPAELHVRVLEFEDEARKADAPHLAIQRQE